MKKMEKELFLQIVEILKKENELYSGQDEDLHVFIMKQTEPAHEALEAMIMAYTGEPKFKDDSGTYNQIFNCIFLPENYHLKSFDDEPTLIETPEKYYDIVYNTKPENLKLFS